MEDKEILVHLLSQDVCGEIGSCILCEFAHHEEKCLAHRANLIAEKLIANNVTPQKNGHWREEDKMCYICSVCNNWATDITPYCPECGAKMTS